MSSIHENRPLSPHVGIYRWQITNTLSILHRLTGLGLTIGLAPLTFWLWSLAYAPEWLVLFNDAARSIVGKVFLFGWTLAFYYHLGNGLRHLNWDMGKGFAIADVINSGRLVVIFAIAMSIFTWSIVAKNGGI